MRYSRRVELSALLAAIDAIDPGLAHAAELARSWADDALAEHASIAEFGRVALQLLALGAPPALIADTHRAALDEVEHARCSFAIAARLGGEPLGPGPLDAALAPLEPAALTAATVAGGCLGETAAAVIAAVERDACEVPAIRAVLARIATDEARHASLAWRTAAWLIDACGQRAAFDAALVADPPRARAASPLLHLGRLGGARAHVAATVHAHIVAAPARFLAAPDRAIAEVMP